MVHSYAPAPDVDGVSVGHSDGGDSNGACPSAPDGVAVSDSAGHSDGVGVSDSAGLVPYIVTLHTLVCRWNFRFP